MRSLNKSPLFAIFPCLLAISGCSTDAEDIAADSHGEAPSTYAFASRFQEDESSVSYSGQILRHVLIADLTAAIGALPEKLESNASFDASKVEANLLSYYEFDSDTQGTQPLLMSTDPDAKQLVYNDISTGKDLVGKIAGQDSMGERDHKDWSKEFAGWSDASIAEHGGAIDSPNGFVRAMLATIGHNAQLQANSDASREGLKTYQTAQGVDLQQLVQKFLLGAVTFSQAADDYLDEGLNSDNTTPDEDAPYTALEHAWDEGFGYFGASRAFLSQSDEEVAAGELLDADEDGVIDLTSEFNFGISANTAKRDVGSVSGTNFSDSAMSAFLLGRELISEEASLEKIKEQAQLAISAWEQTLAASAIHYINDTLADQAKIGSDDYSFDDHAKHWSELKGFALSLQFNPRSPLSDEDFATFHQLIGDAPVLSGQSALSDYEAALLDARLLLESAYGFDAADVAGW